MPKIANTRWVARTYNQIERIKLGVFLKTPENTTILNLFGEIGLNLSKPLRTTLSALIVCLLEDNKAHISRLGESLSVGDASVMACIQRIRRFLSNNKLSPAITVIPRIRLMRPLLSKLPEIVLCMDRTDWGKRGKHINILSVAIYYKGVQSHYSGLFLEIRVIAPLNSGNKS